MTEKDYQDIDALKPRDLLNRIAVTTDFLREEMIEIKHRLKDVEAGAIKSDSWRLVKQDIADLQKVDNNPIIRLIHATNSDHEKRLRKIEQFVYYFLGITTSIMASIKIIEVIIKLYGAAIKP